MYRILIADDEPNILEGLQCVIDWDEHGIEIVGSARNGEEAFEMLSRLDADMLLTDIRMPKTDGLSLIRKLKQEGCALRYIILSGYDDFEYIKEAIKLGIENYLLKPVNREELSTTLLNTIEKIEAERSRSIGGQRGLGIFRENILCRWLTGSLAGDELKEKAALAGIALDEGSYTAAILRVTGREDSFGGNGGIRAKEICAALAGDCNHVFTDMQGDIALLFHSEMERAGIKTVMNRCIMDIKMVLERDSFVSIGMRQTGYQCASESYCSAVELQGYSMILPINSIADYYDVARAVSERQRKFDVDYSLYERLIVSRRTTECQQFIADTFEKLRKVTGITPKFIQNVAVDMLFFTINTVRNASRHTRRAEDSEIDFSSVYKIDSIEGLSEWLKLAAAKAVAGLSDGESGCSPHMRMILAHIHENSDKDLSIKQLSSQFNINAAYLGQLFKNATGEMFTNYINNIRIEKAKELLQTTSLKAVEISELVGYQNTNYFYRIFKKITGVSPSEFR